MVGTLEQTTRGEARVAVVVMEVTEVAKVGEAEEGDISGKHGATRNRQARFTS